MKRFFLLFIITALYFSVPSSYAVSTELKDLYRGVRSTAMGGTYAAMADDEQTLWLNPAGLAAVEATSMHYLPTMNDLALDTYDVYVNNAAMLGSLSPSTLNRIIGKNIYGRVQITPTFIAPGFGVGIIVDGQGAFYAKDQSSFQMTVGYMMTWGVQFGFAYTFSKDRPRKGDTRFSVGASGKVLFRRGHYGDQSKATLLGQTDLYRYIENDAGNYGYGFGVDLGALLAIPFNKNMTLQFGATWLDCGNTSFAGTGVNADPIQNNLAAGVAFKYDNRQFVVNLAYDYRNALQNVDWLLKHHLGVEFGFPLFRIATGISQNSLTFGISMDIWIAKVSITTYAPELSSTLGVDTNRRYILGFDAKF